MFECPKYIKRVADKNEREDIERSARNKEIKLEKERLLREEDDLWLAKTFPNQNKHITNAEELKSFIASGMNRNEFLLCDDSNSFEFSLNCVLRCAYIFESTLQRILTRMDTDQFIKFLETKGCFSSISYEKKCYVTHEQLVNALVKRIP